MNVARFFMRAVLWSLAASLSFGQDVTPPDRDVRNAFFQNYENGRYAEAFTALPAPLREWSPYDKGQMELPPYKRDEGVYFDIMAKASGEKAVPKQNASDKEILYYQGVMHFRMNRLESAKEKLLKCLQLDPTYRMAHVYLFRVFAKLEAELLAQNKDSRQSVGELLIAKLGFGSSDLHLEQAAELLKTENDGTVRVFRLTLRKEDAAIRNLKVEAASVANPKNRGVMNDEVAFARLFRVELVTKGRHCLDEVFFPPEEIFFWDGFDASGRKTGGRDVSTKFDVTLNLVAGSGAERIVVYNPQGEKTAELPVVR